MGDCVWMTSVVGRERVSKVSLKQKVDRKGQRKEWNKLGED